MDVTDIFHNGVSLLDKAMGTQLKTAVDKERKTMKRLTIQVGLYEVNCSILGEGGKAWIVDPGHEADRIASLLEKKGLEPAAILLTHAHFDHIGAVPGLLERFPSLPVYIGEKDMAVISHPMNQLPPDYPPVKKPESLRAIGQESLAALEDLGPLEQLEKLEVIETPGHTPGGVCYYFPEEKLLLSGDTLFAGSVGRTDLPGGDMATLVESLKKLTALPDDTLVVPGHGPHTTIGAEKRSNPFL